MDNNAYSMAPSSVLTSTFCRVLLKHYGLFAVDIIQSFLRIIIQIRLHYLFNPMNIPCRCFLITLIVSNFTKDNAYSSQLRTSTTCFCTILYFAINKLVKKNQTCPCILYNALQVCHYGNFSSYCTLIWWKFITFDCNGFSPFYKTTWWRWGED